MFDQKEAASKESELRVSRTWPGPSPGLTLLSGSFKLERTEQVKGGAAQRHACTRPADTKHTSLCSVPSFSHVFPSTSQGQARAVLELKNRRATHVGPQFDVSGLT